ncbi:MAG: 3-isopropylmalate dehydratase small subunit [Polaromonas sp.]|nr:3-isopropylmalate dehydratase small subunit [Polaromonas sp.]
MQAFRTITGAAIPLLMDDINTDQIIPSAYLKDMQADMAKGFLAYMRRNPDDTSISDFVLEKPQYQGAPILLTGNNFGCGSSREHAVWAMTSYGVRCVIGNNPAEFFRENCLKNGVLPVALDPVQMAALIALASKVDGSEVFTVDLEKLEISGPGAYSCPFSIAPFERIALLEGLDDIGITQKQLADIEAWEIKIQRQRPFMQASIANIA